MQKKKKVVKSNAKATKKAPVKAPAKAQAKTPAKVPVKATAKTAAKPAAVKMPVKAAPQKPAPKKEVLTKKEALKKEPAKIETAPKPTKAPKSATKTAPSESPSGRVETKNMSADALEHYKKWLKLQKQLGDLKTIEYKMSDDYEVKAPLSHRVHGWGVVMQRRDNYIDVLFEVGIKTLIVNYKNM